MTTEIRFPELYRGVYESTRERFAPLIIEGIGAIRGMEVSDDLRPFLAYQVWENPQPSFILLSFMYLASAEASGGITERHRGYLPTVLLASELCAVADDTIDRSPFRSGRPTFPARFGDPSAAPMTSVLSTLVLRGSHHDPRLFELTTEFLLGLSSLELWEAANTYPPSALFEAWLRHRYDQAATAIAYVLDAGLVLNDHARWDAEAVLALSRVSQDVDDVVNILEYRESEGENDDLLSGVVTKSLVRAIEAEPPLRAAVDALWKPFRELAASRPPIHELPARRAALNERLLPEYAALRERIVETGVPATTRESLLDFQHAVRRSPPELRGLMRQLGGSFLDRLRRVRAVDLAAASDHG